MEVEGGKSVCRIVMWGVVILVPRERERRGEIGRGLRKRKRVEGKERVVKICVLVLRQKE